MAQNSAIPSNNNSPPKKVDSTGEIQIPVEISIQAKDVVNYYLGTALFDLILSDRELLATETKKLEAIQQQNLENEKAVEIKRKKSELKFKIIKEWMVLFNYGVIIFIFTLIGMTVGSILTFNSKAVVNCGSDYFFCKLFTFDKK